MFVMPFHVVLRSALQGRKRTDLLCMTHECAYLCVRGASLCAFVLPWFTSTYVCAGALLCGGGPWHRRRRVVQEKASGIIFALGTWGSTAQRRQRCGVSDRRAGLLGLGLVQFTPVNWMYLWEFNATPASVSLSENSLAVFTTKLCWGSVRVSFSSTLQWVKGNDAHLIPIS